jgi:hypothetical protein
MAVRKLKPKRKMTAKKTVKPKSKLKAKSKVKTTKRPKSKLSIKTKAKAKPKAKPKAKLKVKLKAKPKAKTKLKTKPVKKVKAKLALVPLKKKRASKTKISTPFSLKQKTDFLMMITKLINLHKSDKDGLKSLTQVERILDPYNQNYTDTHAKFDAIVEYGLAEDPSAVRKHVFVAVKKDNEINDIYKLLVEISQGKIKFPDMMLKINQIYQDAQKARR